MIEIQSIQTCVYQEKKYTLLKIEKELLNCNLLKKAVHNQILNINALYKNFIDDNFEHKRSVEDHFIQETSLENGVTKLTMCSIDKQGSILKSHSIMIK